MSDTGAPFRLDGELTILPFEGGSLTQRVAPTYQSLLETYRDERDVLILKRFPSGIEDFADELAAEADIVSRPNVKSITRHAANVVDRARPHLDTVSDEERIEILARAIDQYEFQNEYFEQAAKFDSFGRDVGRILLAATWQGGFTFTEETELNGYDTYLRELKRINDRFHEDYLRAGDTERIEKAAQIAEACRILSSDESIPANLLDETVDAILVIEFEEFGAVEREYLSLVTQEVDLICIGEMHSSIQRVWNEPGAVPDLATGLDVSGEIESTTDPNDQIDAIAHYLSTGESPVAREDKSVFRIRVELFEDQIRQIANEIEYLRAEQGWQYNDFAVLFKDSTGPIPEARRILRRSGIPTASATINGLGEDLAVRELYTLARYFVDKSEVARELLEARAEDVSKDLLEAVDQPGRLHDKLSIWIIQTELKERISQKNEAIDAYARFQNVRQVLDIAEFIDETNFLPTDWLTFIQVLKRAISFVTPDQYATDIESEENGVAIDPVRVFKQEQRKAVFLCNVIEGTYPADQQLTDLFPQSWTKQMEHYPGVTTPSSEEVTETFATVEKDIRDPYQTYYRELARRQLAIGVRAASDRVYFCSPDRGTGNLSNRNHQSRFLRELEAHDAFSFIDIGSDEAPRDIYTQGQASEEILGEPWSELEKVQNAASTGKEIKLEETKQRFGAIQALLEESGDLNPRFELAVDSQIDFALGEVNPDE